MSTQQEFLRAAMEELGMSADTFGSRLGIRQATLERWLLRPEDKNFQELDDSVWLLIREILAHSK